MSASSSHLPNFGLGGSEELLKATLSPYVSQLVGREAVIVRLDRRRGAYLSSFELHELVLTLDDGSQHEVIFKDLSPSAVLSEARSAKPAFLYDPRREIETYTRILPHRPMAPRLYGGVFDPSRDRYWLFIEKVSGAPLWQIGDFDAWREAARALASLHISVTELATHQIDGARLIRYDSAYFHGWLKRARAMCNSVAGHDPDESRLLDYVAKRHGEILERLLQLRQGFLHGDCFASNVLVDETQHPAKVWFVDWEMAAYGPQLIDLAALTTGWDDDKRAELLSAYISAMPAERRDASIAEDAEAAMDVCQLHLALQFLGWSKSWSPPTEQQHDWLGDLENLVMRLCL